MQVPLSQWSYFLVEFPLVETIIFMEFLIIGLTFFEIPILDLKFSQVVDN